MRCSVQLPSAHAPTSIESRRIGFRASTVREGNRSDVVALTRPGGTCAIAVPMGCAMCGATPADYFTTAGDAVCRVCHYREQSALQKRRAEQALEEEIPEELRGIGVGRRPAVEEVYAKPGTMLRRGLALMVVCGAAALGWIVVVDFDKLASVLLAATGLGFAMSARGWQVRHYE